MKTSIWELIRKWRERSSCLRLLYANGINQQDADPVCVDFLVFGLGADLPCLSQHSGAGACLAQQSGLRVASGDPRSVAGCGVQPVFPVEAVLGIRGMGDRRSGAVWGS